MSTEAVNSAQIAMLIENHSELKSIIAQQARDANERENKTNETLNKLLIAVTKSEERQLADKEWQRHSELRNDRQDKRMDLIEAEHERFREKEFTPVRDAQQKNTITINLAFLAIGGAFGTGLTLASLFWG